MSCQTGSPNSKLFPMVGLCWFGTFGGRARTCFTLAVTPGYMRARREGRGVQGRPPHRHAKRSGRTTAGSHALSKKPHLKKCSAD